VRPYRVTWLHEDDPPCPECGRRHPTGLGRFETPAEATAAAVRFARTVHDPVRGDFMVTVEGRGLTDAEEVEIDLALANHGWPGDEERERR
jgi:hypothetical protein